MRIGIDARELAGSATGVGTYLGRLLQQWQHQADGHHEWLLYVPCGAGWVPPNLLDLGPSFQWRSVPGIAGTWWEQGALARAVRSDRPDVLFAPAYTAPLRVGAVPVVLTIHDVSYFIEPAWFSRRDGIRRRVLTRLAARRAAGILTVSECSRRDIVRMVGVEPSRVQVVYSGVERPADPAPAEGRPPMVLYVGSIFNRRRVPDLIAAFARVAAEVPGATLEIVGHNRTHPYQDVEKQAAETGLGDRIRLRGYVSSAELMALYRRARLFAFLSEYEGFGFTPLEAMAHNVPALVLDTPVAREVYQEAAVFVRTGDVAATALAMTRLLEDAAARATHLARSMPLLDRYRWPAAAAATLAILEAAGRR